MKRLILFLLAVSATASAQQPQGIDPSQMQEMMKRFQDPAAMQKMQQQAEAARQCMEGIDQAQLDALRARAEAASHEIEKLCAAGKRTEALTKGLELSKDLQADTTVKKMRECSKGMSEMMQDMPWAQVSGLEGLETEKVPTDDDICS